MMREQCRWSLPGSICFGSGACRAPCRKKHPYAGTHIKQSLQPSHEKPTQHQHKPPGIKLTPPHSTSLHLTPPTTPTGSHLRRPPLRQRAGQKDLAYDFKRKPARKRQRERETPRKTRVGERERERSEKQQQKRRSQREKRAEKREKIAKRVTKEKKRKAKREKRRDNTEKTQN